MNTLTRSILTLALLGTSALASAGEAWPKQPIRLVVPFPPGGGTDIIARVVGNKLTETRKWVIVVDNRPGAGGNIGMDLVAKSKPDGYTIGLGQTSNLAVNPTLYTKLPYDPVKDFAPVSTVADAPLVLVVASNSPYKTLADVVAAAKAKPGQITLATPGNGTVAHLTGELFQKAAHIDLQHVPYKGSSQAITDLLGGSVQVFMSSVPTALSQIRGGTMRALAVTSSKRADDLPNVPTINESGYKGFDARTWFGMVAPAGTPPAIVAELNAEINKVLAMPEVRKKITVEGGDVMGGTPEQFSNLIKTEIPRWGKVVKDSGARID
ncbi:Bug family tripartite tricarboxylate transporter substrate binding protein [Massilia litorea]|uniref:Tripartite tricarboxylate transporter substrate binding protein n=1 Tax=Massilia litorea TaxID=2769491 RepID=A0A7L9U733_9BURK|nr:tripartite tricarboxylate transporter substrate binding protein [Massilia litorea]QOL50062.1 tripartite tricarboxylate transporter substrate binding protein [Massilia litorea]